MSAVSKEPPRRMNGVVWKKTCRVRSHTHGNTQPHCFFVWQVCVCVSVCVWRSPLSQLYFRAVAPFSVSESDSQDFCRDSTYWVWTTSVTQEDTLLYKHKDIWHIKKTHTHWEMPAHTLPANISANRGGFPGAHSLKALTHQMLFFYYLHKKYIYIFGTADWTQAFSHRLWPSHCEKKTIFQFNFQFDADFSKLSHCNKRIIQSRWLWGTDITSVSHSNNNKGW